MRWPAGCTAKEGAIGREIVEKIGQNSAILLRSHGVFTLGNTVMSALKAAVILEETAQAVHYALLRGPLAPLPADVVAAGYQVYKSSYGQNQESGARG